MPSESNLSEKIYPSGRLYAEDVKEAVRKLRESILPITGSYANSKETELLFNKINEIFGSKLT